MSDLPFQVVGDILLHKAHAVAERTRRRLRDLQRRYRFPKKVLRELREAGIDVTDPGGGRDAPAL